MEYCRGTQIAETSRKSQRLPCRQPWPWCSWKKILRQSMMATGYRISPKPQHGLILLRITIITVAACLSLMVTRNPENGRMPMFSMTHSADKMALPQIRALDRICLGCRHGARYWHSLGEDCDWTNLRHPRLEGIIGVIVQNQNPVFSRSTGRQ